MNTKTHVAAERLKTCKDFTFHLLYLLHDTYFGPEYLKKLEDIEGHFNWCYSETLKTFFDEEIDFYDNDELYEYFFGYYLDQLYSGEVDSLKKFETFWNNIFNIKVAGQRKEKILLGLYALFEKSFKKNGVKMDIDEKKLV